MTDTPRSTRRDFLQGKAALDLVAQIGATADIGSPLADAAAESYLLRLARQAMACTFEICLNAGQFANATEAGLEALNLVDALEDQLTVYRTHSEVSRLNRYAADEPVPVEARLFALLELAVEIYRDTDGAYDVTSGRLSQAWGFTRRRGTIPSPAELNEALDAVGSCYLQLDAPTRTVRFLQPGLEINLGSIGKGYALDRCGELLITEGVDQFLLHGGNSSVLARGAHGTLAPEEGWQIGVRDPRNPRNRLGTLRLVNGALATSGSGTQFFMHEGRRFGHILDPRTGWPAEGVLSVTVLAPTAAEADALSTAFYVMGPNKADKYCQQHPHVSALMLCPAERAGGLELIRIGLEDDDFRLTHEA